MKIITVIAQQVSADALNAADVPTAHGGARWYASTVRGVARSIALDEAAAEAGAA